MTRFAALLIALAVLAAGAVLLFAQPTPNAADRPPRPCRRKGSRPRPSHRAASGAPKSDFDKLDGVKETISGFMGGKTKNPTYEQVSMGNTGHAESVQLKYDPKVVSYDKLLDYYWRHTDVLDGGGQFCDRGSQYRPVIFVATPEQRKLAEASKAALEKSGRFSAADRGGDRRRGRLHRRRGLPPELLQDAPHPVRLLPPRLRARRAHQAALGRRGDDALRGYPQVRYGGIRH